MQLCPVLDPEFAINNKISRPQAILVHQKLRMKNFDFSEMWCLGFLLCHQRSCIAKRAFPQCCTGVQARGCHLTSCARRGHNIQQLGVAETRHSLSERLRFLRTSQIEAKKQHWRKYLMCFSYLSASLPFLLKEHLNFVSGIHQSSCPAVILWHVTNKF